MEKNFFTFLACLIMFLPITHAQARDVAHANQNNYKSNLLFIQNKGQIVDQNGQPRHDIDFKLNAGNVTVFIGKGKLEYQWVVSADSLITKTYRLDVNLTDHNPQAKLQPVATKAYKEHYYINNIAATAGATDKVVYQNIYPDIDWVVYTDNSHTLKYDFIVHPGGDYTNIKINYAGTDNVLLDGAGNLIITTPAGKLTEKAPYSYTTDKKETVASGYVLNGNNLSFQVAPYEGTLTIDPEIDWATFYGGTDFDDTNPNYYGNLANVLQKNTADGLGNVFIGGYTNTTDNIATTGAFLQELTTEEDLFVAKFDNAGSRLWGTYYYGGSAYNPNMGGMAADHEGNVYFIGNGIIYNESFCTPGCHQDTVSFNTDYYDPGVIPNQKMTSLIKLNGDGERVWATYYGGLSPEVGWILGKNLTVDNDNNVFLSGETIQHNELEFLGIHNNIATDGAHKEDITNDGDINERDAFIVKFNSDGVRQWGTYYGGTNNEIPGSSWGSADGGTGNYAATDQQGNYYITGYTRSSDGISTPGSYQETLTLDNEYNDDEDAFIAKFSPTGTLLWGTYYGGLGYEHPISVSLDNEGNPVIFGNTNSKTNITTEGAFQDTLAFNFGYSGFPFIAKFSPDGERLWGSYFNDPAGPVGNWGINPVNLVVDNDNNYWILLNVYGSNDDFFQVGDQWSAPNEDNGNSILVQFKDNELLWSTYINAQFKSISTDQLSNLFLSGDANATSYTSPGAFLNSFIGTSATGYLLKSTICGNPLAVQPSNFQPGQPVCPNSTVTFSVNPGFDSYTWTLPDGWAGLSDSNSIEVIVGSSSGTISVSAAYQCGETGDLEVPLEVIDASAINFIVNGDTLTANGYDSYTWYFNDEPITGATGVSVIMNEAGIYKAVATTEQGCEVSAIYDYNGTGVDNPAISGIRVYPNPAASQLNIDMSVKARFLVYDIQGRLIKSTNSNIIDISDMGNGNYLLKIVDRKGKVIKVYPFVKNGQ